MRNAYIALAACSGLAVGVPTLPVGQALGATILSYDPGAPAPSSMARRPPFRRVPHARSGSPVASPPSAAPRAPSEPVLGSGDLAGEEASASAPSSGGDPLTGNGLDSPLCRRPGGLSAAQQRSCQTDDFVAAPDPTNNYAFDVSINTGVSKWANDISATMVNFAQLGWMALVSATHGLVVMFEWCYSLNLLSDSLLREVTGALRNARLTFTEPWMTIVLAVAATLAVYNGLFRRRVAETMGQVLAMLAMMAGGLWVIADPAGTVGAVEQWVDQAAVGTMAAVASGAPSHAERTLADSMQVVFSSVVTTPWCYMEFGDVRWCESAQQRDGRLRKADLAIAQSEERRSGCRGVCGAGASPGARTLSASAMLIREAQTNGELFLALPANEPERNSVKDEGMLLKVLCGGGDSADKCSGPTAPQAEFRSEKGTGSRVFGLFFIWVGALGMLLLLGFLALRLLSAALMGLFFLLLAPAAVLAPALGDGGRSAFRSWSVKLMEAVVAKLTYSFLLGVVLMMMKVLLGLTILGWLAQWLLISAFWWGAFLKREQMFGFAPSGGPGKLAGGPRSIARRVSEALETPRALVNAGSAIRGRLRRPAPEVRPRPRSRLKPHTTIPGDWGKQSPARGPGAEGPAGDGGGGKGGGRGEGGGGGGHGKRGEGGGDVEGGERAATQGRKRSHAAEPVERRRDRGLADEQATVQAALAEGGAGQTGQRGQLERVRRERENALMSGDRRRAAQLSVRAQRIEGTLARSKTLAPAIVAPELEAGELAMSAMAGRNAGVRGPRGDRGGDGHGAGGRTQAVSGGPGWGQPERRAGARGGPQAPRSKPQDTSQSTTGVRPAGEQVGPRERARRSSSVMDDAREVAARRKRQLGWGPQRPVRGPER